jgi:hypothetical protein
MVGVDAVHLLHYEIIQPPQHRGIAKTKEAGDKNVLQKNRHPTFANKHKSCLVGVRLRLSAGAKKTLSAKI